MGKPNALKDHNALHEELTALVHQRDQRLTTGSRLEFVDAILDAVDRHLARRTAPTVKESLEVASVPPAVPGEPPTYPTWWEGRMTEEEFLQGCASGQLLGPCKHGRDPYWRCEICEAAVEGLKPYAPADPTGAKPGTGKL